MGFLAPWPHLKCSLTSQSNGTAKKRVALYFYITPHLQFATSNKFKGVEELKITEIAFTGTPVTDIKRARAFYEGVLGLKPTLETLGGMLVEYGIGNGTFTIGCLGETWKPSSDGPFVAFEVEDLDAEISQLESKGVKFAMGATDLPTSRFAVIFDPDGNKIMIHRRKT